MFAVRYSAMQSPIYYQELRALCWSFTLGHDRLSANHVLLLCLRCILKDRRSAQLTAT